MTKIRKESPAVLELLSKKWMMKLLNSLGQREAIRFNEFLSAHPGISPKTLSERLKELELHNVVSKACFNETPPRVQYSLTEKGIELVTIFESLNSFSDKWD